MIDNVVLIVTGTLHERDVNELLEKCHPLGMFDRYSCGFFLVSVEWRYFGFCYMDYGDLLVSVIWRSIIILCVLSYCRSTALHRLQLLKTCVSFTDWF